MQLNSFAGVTLTHVVICDLRGAPRGIYAGCTQTDNPAFSSLSLCAQVSLGTAHNAVLLQSGAVLTWGHGAGAGDSCSVYDALQCIDWF